MALNSNALITLNECKEILSVSKTDANVDDTLYEHFINSASQVIENYCNRKFIDPATDIDEVFDGDGTHEYRVDNGNIVSATTPTINYWDGNSWEELSASLYPRAFENDKGLVYFTQGHVFANGTRNYQIQYRYGYAIANVPADLKVACAMLTQRGFRTAQKQGLSSEALGERTTTYNLGKIPDDIKAVLDKYMVISIG